MISDKYLGQMALPVPHLETPPDHEGADIREAAVKLQTFLHHLPREFNAQLFGDPALLMMLDLLISEFDKKRLPIKSVCIGSGAPQSTALRYIDRLEAMGVVKRHANPCDRRSAHIALTAEASDQLKSALSVLIDAPREL